MHELHSSGLLEFAANAIRNLDVRRRTVASSFDAVSPTDVNSQRAEVKEVGQTSEPFDLRKLHEVARTSEDSN